MRTLTILLLKRTKKNLTKYLSNSHELFTEGMLYSNNVVSWHLRGGSMSFGFDDTGQPTIECVEGGLVCLSKGDSIQIEKVIGSYDILSNDFTGSQGIVQWDRTTYAGEMYAEVSDFSISMKDDDLKSDHARLISSLFPEKMLGTIELRPKSASSNKKRTYPRFESSIGRVKLEEIYPGISFEGGVEIRGSVLSGKRSSENWATLTFQHQDSILVRVWSEQILFQDGIIDALHSRMSIDLGEDSIYHPDIRVSYLHSERQFRATRQVDGVGRQPFTDSYHQLEFDVEAVEWVIGQPDFVFKRLTGNRPEPAVFRSSNCYESRVFDQLRGIDPIHPLSQLSSIYKWWGDLDIYNHGICSIPAL